ncbi:hypothetical protein GCM10010294_18980 [Streptomyces griseoloalbus]|nr:hypothetical protein GCM10010294_18980 [Streptomyces griseoloalbus]
MTEQPTSFERPQPGVDPADPRGALLRTPSPAGVPDTGAALPVQSRSGGDPAAPGAASPGSPGAGSPGTVTPGGTDQDPAGPGSEHSQPGAGQDAEPDAHRPRPAPEGIPVQPAAGSGRAAPGTDGQERRTGQVTPPGRPTPMRRDGDRLRFVGAATRRIARGIDLDEIVMGLCRATVPTFSDAILVYLRDPLPVGDERPTGPLMLRLRRTDRIPAERDTEGGFTPVAPPEPSELDSVGAELCTVRPGSALAEVLRGVRPVFTDAPAARAALPELLGEQGASVVPEGQRAILAPLRGRRRVIGAALFLRRPERDPFEADDLLVAAQLATHSALGIDKAVLYGREAYIADELQRTMLPENLPRCTGVRLATRYLPAAETARVGGDWYDAIPLPGSRVALVVGDVMGHSMTSAAIMGQLRTTAQTLAGLDLPRRRCCTISTSRRSGSAWTAWRPACTRCTTRYRIASPSPTPVIRRPSCCIWAGGPRCCGCPRARRSAWAGWTSRPWSWTRPPGGPCCCTPTAWWSPGCATCGPASSSCGRSSPRPRS